MGDHYSWWIMLPHEDFARIVDLSDQAFTLLAANCTSALNREPLLNNALLSSPALELSGIFTEKARPLTFDSQGSP